MKSNKVRASNTSSPINPKAVSASPCTPLSSVSKSVSSDSVAAAQKAINAPCSFVSNGFKSEGMVRVLNVAKTTPSKEVESTNFIISNPSKTSLFSVRDDGIFDLSKTGSHSFFDEEIELLEDWEENVSNPYGLEDSTMGQDPKFQTLQDSNELIKKKKKAADLKDGFDHCSKILPFDIEASLRANSKLVDENIRLKHIIDEFRVNQGVSPCYEGNRSGKGVIGGGMSRRQPQFESFDIYPGAPLHISANLIDEQVPLSGKDSTHSLSQDACSDHPRDPITSSKVFAARGMSNGHLQYLPTPVAAGTQVGRPATHGDLSDEVRGPVKHAQQANGAMTKDHVDQPKKGERAHVGYGTSPTKSDANGHKDGPPSQSQHAAKHMGRPASPDSLSAHLPNTNKLNAGVDIGLVSHISNAQANTKANKEHMGNNNLSANQGDVVASPFPAQGRVESAQPNTHINTNCSADKSYCKGVGPIFGATNTPITAQEGAGVDTVLPKPWASLVAPKIANDFSLTYIKPREGPDRKIVSMPKEVRIEGSFAWKDALVGYFIGKKLPFSYVKNGTERLWNKLGLRDMVATDSGFYFFKFNSEEESLSILEGGPWHLAGQPIILQKWHAGLTLSKEAITTIPVWVHIFNIPLEYWNPTGLSHIASAIGKPLHVARVTANCRRISFARICIELNAKHELLHEIVIEFEDPISGDLEQISLPVEYQWTPIRCAKCSRFGHDCANLPKIHVKPIKDKTYSQEDKEGNWKEKSKRVADPNSLSGSSTQGTASTSGPGSVIALTMGQSGLDIRNSVIKDQGKNALDNKLKATSYCPSDSGIANGECSHTTHTTTEAVDPSAGIKLTSANKSTLSIDSSEHIVQVINPDIIQGPKQLQHLNPCFTNANAFSALTEEVAVISGPPLTTTYIADEDDKLEDNAEGASNELETKSQPSKPDRDTGHAPLGQQQDVDSSPSTSNKPIHQDLMQRCGLVWNRHNWKDTLQWMDQHLKGKKSHHLIPKLCLGVAVYGLWRERNQRSFKLKYCPKEITLNVLISQVKDLITVKWKNQSNLESMLCRWN